MIDHIIGWDGKYPIYSSDINPYSNYIGYEDEKSEIHLYEQKGENMEFVKTYGGREKYFKKVNVRDCVIRAICNATGLDYQEVYNTVKQYQEVFYQQKGTLK